MRNRVAEQGVAALTASMMLVGAQGFAATVTVGPSHDNTIADGVDPGSGEDFRDDNAWPRGEDRR